MSNIEIERKFLLKSIPDLDPDDMIEINQFYFKNSLGIWERARSWESKYTGDIKYVHTIKKNISKASSIEDEYFLTLDEFNLFKEKCFELSNESKFISKTRFIYKSSDLKWEVDLFKNDYRLIIAEIEIPSEDHDLFIDDFIENLILLEVTGMKPFSNRSLALKIKKK